MLVISLFFDKGDVAQMVKASDSRLEGTEFNT